MQQPAGVVEKGLCSLCTKIVWNNQERFQTPEGGYVHNACHLAYKGTCTVCSKTVFDFDERWRTPEGTYVHKACVPNAESVQLSRGIAADAHARQNRRLSRSGTGASLAHGLGLAPVPSNGRCSSVPPMAVCRVMLLPPIRQHRLYHGRSDRAFSVPHAPPTLL